MATGATCSRATERAHCVQRACASAGESLTPSPTIATTSPSDSYRRSMDTRPPVANMCGSCCCCCRCRRRCRCRYLLGSPLLAPHARPQWGQSSKEAAARPPARPPTAALWGSAAQRSAACCCWSHQAEPPAGAQGAQTGQACRARGPTCMRRICSALPAGSTSAMTSARPSWRAMERAVA